jgi:hypothetical protein
MNRFQRYVNERPSGERDFYQQWLDAWDQRTLAKAIAMAAKLEAAGCRQPEGWIFSELHEGIPQSARFALLQSLWERAIKPAVTNDFWLSGESNRSLLEKIDQALSLQEKQQLFSEVANSLTFHLLNTLDEGSHGEDLPGWSVVERSTEGRLTGRELGGLHESVFEDAFRPDGA